MAEPVKKKHPQKELFKRLRTLRCEELWEREVAAFDAASPAERNARVAVVRAVGVVLGESGEPAWRDRALPWLRALLEDPSETVRRYAIVALPRVGAGEAEEQRLLELHAQSGSEKEQQTIAEALQKIGGPATLARLRTGSAESSDTLTEQKIRARLARDTAASTVRLDARLAPRGEPLVVALRCRDGLEDLLRDEVATHPLGRSKFRLGRTHLGLVELHPAQPFTLAELFSFRTFDTLHLVLGRSAARHPATPGEIAEILAGPEAQRILETFTEGPWRYRLDFVGRGHQRQAVREIGQAVYARAPRILNDARHAPWTVLIRRQPSGTLVELSPHGSFDPRFAHRHGDIPAASHPPLAAALARLAGPRDGEIAWDPFCGSGQELIERARLGGHPRLLGSDLSAEALAVARQNAAAAGLDASGPQWAEGDFRNPALFPELAQAAVTLLLTNPPMGRRIPVDDIRGMVRDLFATAERVLAPDGRLVLINPLNEAPPTVRLRQIYRRKVDLGGFFGWLEKYER